MALDDTAVLAPSTGHFYTAVYNATTPVAMPADLAAPGVSYTEVGHTSLEDILSSASEGGDATVLGTLQNKQLRTAYSPRTEQFTFTIQQFDEAALKLYYGSNAVVDTDGNVMVPNAPTPSIVTFLLVLVDGTTEFGLYIPKAEIFRAEDLEVSDTESLAGLTVNVRALQHASNTWNYKVTPLGA